jgi:hypothetical protein
MIDAAIAARPEPMAGLCPAGCGCTWRPPVYTPPVGMTFGLLGPNSKSCAVCEPLPWDGLIHVYAAPPSTAAMIAEKDAEIERLRIDLSYAQEKSAFNNEMWIAANRRAEAAEQVTVSLNEHCADYEARYNREREKREAAEHELAATMQVVHEKVARAAKAERALAGAKAQALREAAEWFGQQRNKSDPAPWREALSYPESELFRMASEHERGER